MTRRIQRLMIMIVWLLGGAGALHAQTYTLSPSPFLLAQDNSGRIINNACVWTYAAGTTTAVFTYSDTSGTQNLNPIRSDSAGRFTAYLLVGTTYKFVYEAPCVPPAHGTVLRTQDNIAAVPASAATVDLTGTAGEGLAVGQAVYLSDGSGGKTQGQWYKADSANAYSSTTPTIGIALAAITSTTSGAIRVAGAVTGLSSLSIGQTYFVGTGGAITATAPTNARYIGQADTATSLVLDANPTTATLVSPTITTPTITSPTITTSILGPLTLGCGIRLTLTAGTPVTTADVTAAPTIFATPYSTGGWGAGICSFYDGSATWTTLAFTETSIPLGTITSGKPYDVFCYNNAGTMACEFLVWTSDSARATALVLQNGVLVKTGATTRRYIGTFYTTSTTTTEDSVAKRLVWNYYNRAPRWMSVLEATASWGYNTATYRQANAPAGNQLELFIGVAEVQLQAWVNAGGTCTANTARENIGEDSTTTPLGTTTGLFSECAGGVHGRFRVDLLRYPAAGHHTYVWLEFGDGGNTWYGSTFGQSGISGWIQG